MPNHRRALRAGAATLAVVGFTLALPPLAGAITQTQEDVNAASTTEARVLTLLHNYFPGARWKAEFKAAVAAQASALGTVDKDVLLAVPPPAISSTLNFRDLHGTPYSVTLLGVLTNAEGAVGISPSAGHSFASATFRVTDLSKTTATTDDADTDATVIGSNAKTYSAAFGPMASCTSFENGQYDLGPGQSATGCVAFQLPTGVGVSAVEWSSDGGLGGAGTSGEWTVG